MDYFEIVLGTFRDAFGIMLQTHLMIVVVGLMQYLKTFCGIGKKRDVDSCYTEKVLIVIERLVIHNG